MNSANGSGANVSLERLANLLSKKIEQLSSAMDGTRRSEEEWLGNCRSTMTRCFQNLEGLLKEATRETTLATSLRRLENMSRECKLKFGADGGACFISSDGFRLEVQLDEKGVAVEVKLAHGDENNAQRQPLLRQLLSKGQFDAFHSHLKGLSQVFDLPGNKEEQSSVYQALCAVEQDLIAVGSPQGLGAHRRLSEMIMCHPLGAVLERDAGRPMSLTFFITPRELINHANEDILSIVENDIGVSGKVGVAASLTTHQLPVRPLHQLPDLLGESSEVTFEPLVEENRCSVPATYCLRLNRPILLCAAVATTVQSLTDMQDTVLAKVGSLHASLLQASKDGSTATQPTRQQHDVALPSGSLSFRVNEAKVSGEAVQLQEILFTHPSKIAPVLTVLRQHLVYNTLIQSCTSSGQVVRDRMIINVVDVQGQPPEKVLITFELPSTKNLACVSCHVKTDGTLSCKLHIVDGDPCPCSDETLTRIVQSCLSIPVTIHSLLKRARNNKERSPVLALVAQGKRRRPDNDSDGGAADDNDNGTAAKRACL